MWRRFVKENFWYVVALGAALAVMLISLCLFFGNQSIRTTRAQNAARAISLSGEIASLPRVSSIVPAKTSGALDYVETSRSNLAAQISTHYTPRYAPWIFGLIIPAYYATTTQQSRHTDIANDTSDTLNKTARDLRALKKIIEYMPLVDLGESFNHDAGLSERLNRTRQGLSDAMEYIRYSGLPHTTDLIKMLTKTNAQTLTLTDETKASWADQVLDIQKLILSDIQEQDVQQSTISDQLQTISQKY